jgi:putative membrane protein
MLKLLLRWALNALVLLALPYLLESLRVDNFYAALIAALCIGLVNALIRPVLILITLPINILTLGLFTFVINGLLFWLVASVVKGFYVTGFWAAFWGALLYSLCSALASLIVFGRERKTD